MDVQTPTRQPVLVQEALDEFRTIELDLKQRLEDLRAKRELLNAQTEGEMVTVWMMNSWSAADALSRREEDLAKWKREKNQVDLSIVDVYEKLSTLQLERISTVSNKLKAIYSKNPHQICLLEYNVENVKQQMSKNAQMIAFQSQILELMSKKVRLTQESAKVEENEVMDENARLCHVDPRKRFRKLRQRDYAQIDAQFSVDKAFADYVDQLLDINGFNFESVKLKEYIDQCRTGIDESGESYASPKNYQSFICALSQYILDKFGVEDCSVDPSVRLDQTYTLVEGILFPHIEQFIQPFLDGCTEKDLQLNEKYERLSDLGQWELGIKEAYIDTRLYPHCQAITNIMKMNMVSTPSQKLRCILAAAHETNQFMSSLCGEKMVPGADEFMDVWVYVLLKARLPKFFSTVSLLRSYSNPRIGLSEFGYYLASFELAGEYILMQQGNLSLIKSTLSNDESAEVFFIPETGRCLKFVENCDSLFEVVQNEFCLEGYTLIADLDLQLETGRLITTYLVQNHKHHVYGTLMRCSNKAKRKLAKKWIESQFNKVSDDVRGKVVDGLIIPFRAKALFSECRDDTLNISSSSGLKRYIEIPNGKYEDFRTLFQRYLSLENLGYIKKKAEEDSLEVDQLNIDEMEGRVKAAKLLLFKGHEIQEDLDDFITEKVKDIQTRLRHCNMYSCLLPVDGVYAMGTRHSVQLFQKSCGQYVSGDDELQVNGICDSRTYELLCRAPVTNEFSNC